MSLNSGNTAGQSLPTGVLCMVDQNISHDEEMIVL
jgi:hypothetical protein